MITRPTLFLKEIKWKTVNIYGLTTTRYGREKRTVATFVGIAINVG
jgi:hypothetical protein